MRKPTCHCAKPNDPGHDPQLRLTRTVNGKTVAESFASPAAFQKAQAEVHEYQRWQRLCAELVDVGEKICRLRPLQKQPGMWSAEEKNGCCGPSRNRARIRHPVASYLCRSRLDFSPVDSASRTASAVPLLNDGPYIPFCEQGGKMQISQDVQRDQSSMSLDAIGGEPLAGSGFETEEPELEFSSAELSGEG